MFSVSFVTISKLFCGELLEIFVIFSATSLPIKCLVNSADFLINLFDAVLNASVSDCLA